jgi:hypothetical protein
MLTWLSWELAQIFQELCRRTLLLLAIALRGICYCIRGFLRILHAAETSSLATARARLKLGRLRWMSPVATILGLLGLAGAPILYWLGWHVSDFILWATGLILLAYTLETQGMRQQMVRQYEIELHPLVIITIENARDLLLKNIGRSPAVSIRVAPLSVKPGDGTLGSIQVQSISEFVADFHLMDYLDSRGVRPILYTCYYPAPRGEKLPIRGEKFTLIPHLSPPYARRNYCMAIHYEDINGNPHETLVQMGKDGMKLLSHT